MAERLCTRLDAEPVIFRGCTTSELGILLAAAVLLWLPAGFVLAALLGALSMGVGFAAIGVLATLVVGTSLMSRIKRNRPEAYYLHRMAVILHQLGLRRSPFVLRTGSWDLGRTE